ncbi:MAG TPA: hypothetical protein VLW45_02665 [Pelomicrobium sp.]|nr:hypothetical protein [Pelomicrobium sp.]
MLKTFATLVLLLFTGGTLAQTTAAEYHQRLAQTDRATFQQLDRNADGRVSRQEATGMVDFVGRFEAMDLNRDGYVSAEELKTYHDRQEWVTAASAQ